MRSPPHTTRMRGSSPANDADDDVARHECQGLLRPNAHGGFDVFVDADRDGTDDFAVCNLENGGFGVTGQNVVAVANLRTNTAVSGSSRMPTSIARTSSPQRCSRTWADADVAIRLLSDRLPTTISPA